MTRARGFTLIEVLVATLVLSVGLFGAASLLLHSLQDHGQALRHRAAGMLVVDMAARIRANPRGAAHYVLHDTPRTSAGDCHAEPGCDPQALAASDIAEFQAAVAAQFESLAPAVLLHFVPATGPAAPDRTDIILRWSDTRAEALDEVRASVLAQLPVAG
jgi:type IV pilus assembly protein PilV